VRKSHRRAVLAGTTLCVDAAERRSESRGRVLLSLQTRGFLFRARSAAPRIRSARRSHHCFFSSLRPHAAYLRGLSEFKLAVLAAVESSVPREAGLLREGLRYHAGAHTERQPATSGADSKESLHRSLLRFGTPRRRIVALVFCGGRFGAR